jgi:E3 ubiquitin-protein ligase TRIP12
MKCYISPFIHPDVKKESSLSQNPYQYNYSYNAGVNKASSKIGIGPEEQRLISKKAVRVLEALTFVITNWSEIRHHFPWLERKTIMLKPDELYKHLLDEYVQKILFEPLNFILDHKKHKTFELMQMLKGNQYLLSFETRVFFLKTAAFSYSGEFHRTVHFLIQHLRKKYTGVQDQSISKQSKEKVRIDRKNILESSIKLFTTPGRIKKKNFLEIEYCNEEGTGLGPTLEFYFLCSKEFRKLTHLWKNTPDNSLFPLPFAISSEKYGKEIVLKYFETMGALVAKALSDDRLTDLPFSSVFWDLCIGEPMTFSHITKLDPQFGNSVNELLEYSMKKKSILENDWLKDQIKERQLAACKLKNGASVEDLYLFFCIPGSDIELKPKGKDLQVTEDNLDEYLDLLLEVMLGKSIQPQIDAFKKGFGRDMDFLKVLKSDEIELIICGNSDDDQEWTIQNLKEHIVPAHGYHENSQTYLDLLKYMVQLSEEKRRQFLAFVTGSPRLPLGGKLAIKQNYRLQKSQA